MPSTFSSLLRFELQADGENDGTWGQILNDNVIELVEDAVAATTAINTTGGTTTLTTNDGAEDQARKMQLEVTGALTAEVAVDVPAVSKLYLVRNDTTNSFDVEIKVDGQAADNGVDVPQGYAQWLYCDGTDVRPAGAPVQISGQSTSIEAVTFTQNGNTVLDASDLAANGGSIPETDEANTFASDQTFSAQVLGKAGTAASPSLSFSGDPDTGFYSDTADEIRVSLGGSLQWQWSSDGSYNANGETDQGAGTINAVGLFVQAVAVLTDNDLGSNGGDVAELSQNQTFSGNNTFTGDLDHDATSATKVAAGTTAQRPGTPEAGDTRLNTTNTQFEGYNGTSWGPLGGAGYFQGENGARGDTVSGKGDIFRVNEQVLNTDVTIASGDNASCAGPLEVASGTTLTVNGVLVIV